MGGTASMFYSGAVEAAAGTVVSGAVSSVTTTFVKQDELDVTLYSLKHEVLKIQSAIDAARGRRISNQKILEWLAEIIAAAYLGNYYHRTFKNWSSLPLMISSTEGTDNFHTYNYPTRRAAKRRRTIKSFLFGNDEHRELHDALKMLKNIDICAFILMVNGLPERPMKKYPYMDDTRLINRVNERVQVMNFLFEPSMAYENNVDILPIVGPEGVGKTTLALHCFCDSKVQNHFSLKIYIRSSVIAYPSNPNYCGPPWIFKEILEQCKITQITNYDENTLLAMLKQNLSSERLLLVMDDVWHPDSTVWNTLLGCLRCGKEGSKIIILTQNATHYKNIMSTGKVKPIMLDGFLEDEFMLFFREHAFGSADPEDHPKLAEIGGEIAKKMNGSIWGAKIIGELLRDNLSAPFWSIFLRNGLLGSGFLHSKDLLPVINTIAQLLPKRLYVEHLITTWGKESSMRLWNEPKYFRELMVLDPKYCTPKYCTPVIKDGKNYGVQFIVAKHFNLYDWTFYIARCNPICDESEISHRASLSVDIDDQ